LDLALGSIDENIRLFAKIIFQILFLFFNMIETFYFNIEIRNRLFKEKIEVKNSIL